MDERYKQQLETDTQHLREGDAVLGQLVDDHDVGPYVRGVLAGLNVTHRHVRSGPFDTMLVASLSTSGEIALNQCIRESIMSIPDGGDLEYFNAIRTKFNLTKR